MFPRGIKIPLFNEHHPLLLGELRLPGVKLIWAKLASQFDWEVWSAVVADLSSFRGYRRPRGGIFCREATRRSEGFRSRPKALRT